jgi:hypothetical protein
MELFGWNHVLLHTGGLEVRSKRGGNAVYSDTVHNRQGQNLKGKVLVEDVGVDGAVWQAMCV